MWTAQVADPRPAPPGVASVLFANWDEIDEIRATAQAASRRRYEDLAARLSPGIGRALA